MPTIYKSGKNYGGGTIVDSVLNSVSENPVQNKAVTTALSGKLSTSGNSQSNTVTYTTGDDVDANVTTSTGWTSVNKMTSSLTHSTLLYRISTMMKNVRWLYKMLGTTDISSLGDGTVTGAINALNNNLSSLFQYVTYSNNDIIVVGANQSTQISFNLSIPDNCKVLGLYSVSITDQPSLVFRDISPHNLIVRNVTSNNVEIPVNAVNVVYVVTKIKNFT